MKATLITASTLDMVYTRTVVEIDMKVILPMIDSMVRENTFIKMEMCMKVSL